MTAAAAVQQAPDPIEALNQLNEIVTKYCESQMFFAACEIGIFEQLAQGPATAVELAAQLKAHPGACRRLLAGLAQMGLVVRQGDAFSINGLSRYLTAGAAVPLEALSVWGSLFYPMWGHLGDAVREYAPRWEQAFGATQQETFANLYKNPKSLRHFCGIMSAYSIPQGKLLAEAFDFTPHGCVLDVAGGPGGMIIEVGRKYPHMRGIVMDLPPVCELAAEAICAAGLEERFTTQFADLFAGPYPAGADTIALSWVLHDWNDQHCREILKNCHDALPAGGALLITESVLNSDGTGSPFALLMSLHMLILCEPDARERTGQEYSSLLEETGFRMERVVRMNAPRDLIVARKI
jgi:hypothetical protein